MQEEQKIFGQHADALRVVDALKKEIQCDGEICRPIGLIPDAHYNSYVSIMKKNFTDTDTRVLKQRQFSSLVNKLFEDRGDYVYHASVVQNKPENIFYHEGGGMCTLKVSGIPSNDVIHTTQKNAFFLMREMGRVADEFTFKVDISKMSTLDMIQLYFRSAGADHVVGYLMFVSTEAPTTTMTIRTANRFQRACAKLIVKAIAPKHVVVQFT